MIGVKNYSMFFEGTPDSNIFKLYPELKTVPEFVALTKEFGSKLASKIIWAISYLEDVDSKIYGSPVEVKRKNVEATILGTEIEWESDIIKEAIHAYTVNCMTVEATFLKTFADKIHSMRKFINNSNVEVLLDSKKQYMKTFDSALTLYDKAKERYISSKTKNTEKKVGNYKPSGSERGEFD